MVVFNHGGPLYFHSPPLTAVVDKVGDLQVEIARLHTNG